MRGMCIDMRIDMCKIRMSVDVCMDMRIVICIDTRTDTRMDMCMDMAIRNRNGQTVLVTVP